MLIASLGKRRDIRGDTVLVKKIIDGYWALIGPDKPVMRLGSREDATKMAKDIWTNFILQTQFEGRVYTDDLTIKEGKASIWPEEKH